MISRLSSLIALALLLACQQKETLTFEPYLLNNASCTDCPEVKISLPQALGKSKIARSINTALKEEVIAMLIFDDTMKVASLEQAMASFQNGYTQLKALYPDEPVGWKAAIQAEVTYEDEHWISIRLEAYTFTGGAHGYGATRFLNFDKQKGVELESWELFRDENDFQRYAETKFRRQEQIPADKPINSTGFMFENDLFYLPENIGLCPDGIKLHYNQYEVASFADGPIELTLPFREAGKFLTHPVKS